MTTKDLMQRLGLGYRSATELMRSSGFTSIQVGKKFVVDEQAYEKWYRLNQGRQVIRQPEPQQRRSTTKTYTLDYNERLNELKRKLKRQAS